MMMIPNSFHHCGNATAKQEVDNAVDWQILEHVELDNAFHWLLKGQKRLSDIYYVFQFSIMDPFLLQFTVNFQ